MHQTGYIYIYMGFYFGPHHLIMDTLLYFEEKVHRKKLQRADVIPLLFFRLLCYVLEHIGYPTEPHLECRHHCLEHFTLDQNGHSQQRGIQPKQPYLGQYLQYQHSLTGYSKTSIPQSLFHPPLLHHLCLRAPLLILQLHHLFHQLYLLHHRTLSPFLAQSFVAWYYYLEHSTPHTTLYFGK